MAQSHEELPTNFDIIVVGSGLPESILAAACARSGVEVLHLDRNEYYGCGWASFNLDGIKQWLDDQQMENLRRQQNPPAFSTPLEDGERFIPFSPTSLLARNVQHKWHLPEHGPTLEPANKIAGPFQNPESATYD